MKQIYQTDDTVDIIQTWFGSIYEKPRTIGTARITEINSRYIVLDNGDRFHKSGTYRSIPKNNCLELRLVDESGKYFYLQSGDKIQGGDEEFKGKWLPVPATRIDQYCNSMMPKMRRLRSR